MPRSPFSKRLHQLLARQFAAEASFDPSRRRFVQTSALAIATLATTSRCSLASMIDTTSSQTVAIVGAGAAGLAAAYHLRRQGIPFQIFEASNRVGGRIFTDDVTFAPQKQFAEFGAELINTDHHSIRVFAQELGVEVQEFSDAELNNFNDTFFFNGRAYSEAEIIAASAPLMRAVLRDNGLIYGTDEQLPITYNCKHASAARPFDLISLSDYLDSIPELEEWFKAIVKIGYESDSGVPAAEQSVLLLFSYFTGTTQEDFSLFGSSDETARIKGGNSRLIEAAYRAVGGNSVTKFEHVLEGVRDAGKKIELTFSVDGSAKTMTFSRVILAIPFTILRKVAGFSDSSLAIDARVMKAVRELQYGKNSKMLLGYNERVWRKNAAPASGMSISDLFTLNTWETSRMQDGAEGILTSYSPSGRAADLHPGHMAQVTSDIEKIFPGTKAQFNGRFSVKNWPNHKFVGGSYSSPRMGQFTSIVGCADQPLLGGRLLLAGEQTAPYYFGYMEGAVESGFRAAAQIINSHTA